MKLHLLLLTIICLGVNTIARAQSHTVMLDEITVEGLPFEKYSSGSKMQKADSSELSRLAHGTLAEYMQRNTTVYIKEQGNKMLATVSFRGTGASHTAVIWHGLNLNSLTLGSSDFNGVPLFLFDEIAVQYGGASSLHGSDAIGGSIHLGSKPRWTNGSKIQIRQQLGSFGNMFSGIKAEMGNGKWEYKTRALYHGLKNNFEYQVTDRIGNSYQIEQQNAGVNNAAILQEVNGKIGKSGILSINGWYGSNRHQIQPIKASAVGEQSGGDEIEDKNLRLVAQYQHYFPKGTLTTGLGYVWDDQLFNKTDQIETRRGMARLAYEWHITGKTTINAGGNAQMIVPNVWSYADGLTEWREDLFVSINQQIWQNWQVNLNARKTFVPFASAPVAPSLAASYLLSRPDGEMKFRAQIERSYRVPTFNDRYWGNQGRRDLKAENGYSMEVGHHYNYSKNKWALETDVAAYYMVVDDWLAWKPAGSVWRPYNLKKVAASGIELSGKANFDMGWAVLQLGGMYAYNRAILLRGVSSDDSSVGHQLSYTPRQRVGINATATYRSISFGLDANYTGRRNGIDVVNNQIEGYLLSNFSIAKISISAGTRFRSRLRHSMYSISNMKI
ncbi:MAG: TonB-dependent receptor [Cyclobacteriaceae bacterium]|nr:TonB-dependent receptor [Cyclobacteriaceae bacterium]